MRVFALVTAIALTGCSTIKEELPVIEQPAPVVVPTEEKPVEIAPVVVEEPKAVVVAEAPVEETKEEETPLFKDIYDAIGFTMFILTALAAVLLIVFGKKNASLPLVEEPAATEVKVETKSEQGNK